MCYSRIFYTKNDDYASVRRRNSLWQLFILYINKNKGKKPSNFHFSISGIMFFLCYYCSIMFFTIVFEIFYLLINIFIQFCRLEYFHTSLLCYKQEFDEFFCKLIATFSYGICQSISLVFRCHNGIKICHPTCMQIISQLLATCQNYIWLSGCEFWTNF